MKFICSIQISPLRLVVELISIERQLINLYVSIIEVGIDALTRQWSYMVVS